MSNYKQDMPPPGGYKKLPFERVPMKTFFKGRMLIVGIGGMTLFNGFYFVPKINRKWDKIKTEESSARLVVHPLLIAERDRAYLKQLRKNRDCEAELMKDVPGWVVGTYWGEPVYLSRPKDEWHDPAPCEYWAHTSEFNHRVYATIQHYFITGMPFYNPF